MANGASAGVGKERSATKQFQQAPPPERVPSLTDTDGGTTARWFSLVRQASAAPPSPPGAPALRSVNRESQASWIS